MATPQNDSSVRLYATSPRNINPALAHSLTLVPTTNAFQVNYLGTIGSPTLITFRVDRKGLYGNVTWNVTGASLTTTGDTATLAFSSMGGSTASVYVTLTEDGVAYTSNVCNIGKNFDGAPGSNGTNGLNVAVASAYQRSASAPSGTPGAVTYDFPTGVITTTTLANGWSKSIPAGSNPLYVTVASASSNTSTDTIGSGEWSTAVILAQDGAGGAAGLNNATVFIYQRTNTTVSPTLPSASTTYTFSTGGLTGLNNGWSTTFPTSTLAGQYVHVSTATASATTATDTITAGEWAASKILAQNGASINNIVPDPTFRDLGFWNRTGYTVTDYSAGSTTWKMASTLKIQETGDVLVDTATGYFAMTPGATYRVEIQVFLSSTFAGSFSPFWHVPNDQYHQMGCPDTTLDFADGLPIAFNSSSTKNVITTYTAVYTVPANGYTFQSQIRLKSKMTAGYVEIGSISLVRMANTELIPPSVTLTTPIIVTGFSVASLSDLAGSGGAAGTITSRSYGSRTASASGGTSPYTYSWSVTQSAGTYPITATGTSTATITLGGKGKDESNDATVTVTVNDSSGFSATKSFNLSEVHGTPP